MKPLLRSRWTAVALLSLGLLASLLSPPAHPGHGLRASYWDGSLAPAGEPDRTLLQRSFSISVDGNQASSNQTVWCLVLEGQLELPAEGEWGFRLDSDDGSRLWLDGRLVVDNTGIHPRRLREGRLRLEAGPHDLRLEYAENLGESYLTVELQPPGEGWRELPLGWVRPAAPTPVELLAEGQAELRRALLLGLSAALVLLAFGLRLCACWREARAALRDAASRRAALGSLLARGWVQDLAVVAVCLPFYVQTIATRLPVEPYMKGDSIYYANTAVSLLRDHDLDQRNQTDQRIFTELKPWTQITLANSNISRGQRGEWYPKHPVLMPALSVPFLALWGGFGLVLYNLASLLLLLVVMRRLAARFARPGAAAAGAVLVGLSPMFHNFAYSYCPDILSALLVVAGLLAAAHRRGALAGLALGLAVWVKLPNALAGLLLGLGLVAARDWRLLARLALGAAISLGAFAALNWYQFGAPWWTSYQRVWVVEGGVSRLGDHVTSFTRPFWDGVRLQLFNDQLGLLSTASVGVLGWLGLGSLGTRSRLLAFVAAAFGLLTFLLYCKYDYTHASHFSNRFLMPVVALSSLPLGCLIDRLLPGGRPGQGST
ncbi:MAG TPA: PA14 domain-containing protein [Myxococcota bacterium]|nr:PA14 domain-containing protein [Myxococcota bacterium]HRY93866.1 PA14 domain-containing protein [Myxococcota bacterium]HSA23681.1 PA14 domain-containing protein [Myxococcota bacterium]